MSRNPLRNCGDCRWCEITERSMKCAHAHEPPFVLPSWEDVYTGDYGWMRRCADFAPNEAHAETLRAEAEAVQKLKHEEQQRRWRAAAGQGFDSVKRILPGSTL